MNRTAEVEILAQTLEEPARSLMRAALVAQREGRIDAAAKLAADQASRRPSLRWAAFLLALDAAELRLAGSVAFTTPTTRYEPGSFFGSPEERWGAFRALVYPGGERLTLVLYPTADPITHTLCFELDTAVRLSDDAVSAMRELQRQLETHLAIVVTLRWITG